MPNLVYVWYYLWLTSAATMGVAYAICPRLEAFPSVVAHTITEGGFCNDGGVR